MRVYEDLMIIVNCFIIINMKWNCSFLNFTTDFYEGHPPENKNPTEDDTPNLQTIMLELGRMILSIVMCFPQERFVNYPLGEM